MKKTMLYIVLITILVFVLDRSNNESHPTTHQNLAALSSMHIKFSSPKTNPKLTPQQAKEIADKISPYDATEAKQVFVEYQLITDTATKVPHYGFMHRVSCYIVSYEGLHLPIHQSIPGGPMAPAHTEVNYVIDANMGQPLVVFSYR